MWHDESAIFNIARGLDVEMRSKDYTGVSIQCIIEKIAILYTIYGRRRGNQMLHQGPKLTCQTQAEIVSAKFLRRTTFSQALFGFKKRHYTLASQ